MEKLVEWKDNPHKKPLMIQGIPYCGKTYLLKDFGKRFYKDVLYFDFEVDERLADFFEPNLNPYRIVKDLSLFSNKDVKPGTTLILFDGIHTCSRAVDSLQYFSDEAPEYHIIAAGSFLDTSFPKLENLTLFPMNFYEFLLAQNSMLAMHLRENSFKGDALRTFKT